MSVDLDELDRLRAAATPGEWKVLTIASPDGISERLYAEDGASAIDLAHIPMPWPKHGRLIVALVNAYPALAAELRALRKVRDEVQQRNLRYGCGCAMWLPFPERCPHVEEP